MNKNFYKNKKILITGCTGFTGGWLILYLQMQGAKIFGYSKKPPFNNSIFKLLKLNKNITFLEGNIENFKKLNNFFKKVNPELIFHLAANPIVKDCYSNPIDAFYSNSIGTLNLLEIVRKHKNQKKISLNVITTDKVYKNIETQKKFKETDFLGGDDPYSASKVCAEIMSETFYRSYFKQKKININIFRSGNIIGGGDWSNSRLIPDIINAVFKNRILVLRNPRHTRPWQHIFDVVHAYSLIAKEIYIKKNNSFQSWNIGPSDKKKISVKQIVKMATKKFYKKIDIKFKKSNIEEKSYLQLNSHKVYKTFKIKNKINTYDAVKLTVDWYNNFFNKKKVNYSKEQLKKYLNAI